MSAMHSRAANLPWFLGTSLAVLLLQAAAFGASITISGTIKDASGKPISGASIYVVADDKVKAFSGADGAFTLSGTIPDVPGKTKVPVAAAKDGLMTAQVLAQSFTAKDVQFTLYPSLIGQTVTLNGNRMSQAHVREEGDWDNSKQKCMKEFLFVLAFDGPPGIKAEVEQIWKDYYPGDSLDGDAARELENQFKTRLRFFLEGPLAGNPAKSESSGTGHLMAITGTVREQDGRKMLSVTQVDKYSGPTYPDRVMQADNPLVKLPVKPGLTIKLTDALSDTLIYVPAGKFYMGNPLEQVPHWREAPQHMVTLTKGIFVSDHPVLNSEYTAVTGDTTGNSKNYPADAACNISCAMFDKYVKALQKLNPGKVIRAPTKAEWEYFARSGTSNLYFEDNKTAKAGETMDLATPVKSKKPNAWGFYGLNINSNGERSSDDGFYSADAFIPDSTDPRYPCKKCLQDPACYHIHACGSGAHFPLNELLNDEGYVGTDAGGRQRNNHKMQTERIVVEE